MPSDVVLAEFYKLEMEKAQAEVERLRKVITEYMTEHFNDSEEPECLCQYCSAFYEIQALNPQPAPCGNYKEHWEHLGRSEDWQGCPLPKDHEGACSSEVTE